jgi:hypothetical protein
MAVSMNTACQNRLADSLSDAFDGGTLLLLKGTRAGANVAETAGDVCVTITLPSPCTTAGAAGVAAKTGTWSANAGANASTGVTLTWYRFKNVGSTIWYDGAIGAGLEMTLDNYNVASGQAVTVNTFNFNQPAA